ncbi:MAG: hypothetical protein CUN56_09210, partial [Phototrophicales bacterium]
YDFDYQITNSSGSSVATVTIDIVQTPIANDDTFSVVVGSNLAGNVTADNGSGADNPGTPPFTSLTFGGGNLGGSVTDNLGGATVSFAGGSLTLNNDGSMTLNGATTWGQFTFQYQLTNAQGQSNIATVTIDVFNLPTAVDDGAPGTPAYTVNAGTSFTSTAAAGIRQSNDDYTLPNVYDDATVTRYADVGGIGGGSTVLVGNNYTIPSSGGVVVNIAADGTITIDATAGGVLGAEYRFDYEIANSAGADVATVTILIRAAPDGIDDTDATVLGGTSAPGSTNFHLAINTSSTGVVDVTTNDSLGIPNALTDLPADIINNVILAGTPDAGNKTIGGGAFTIGGTGSIEITATGLVNITPPNNFVGLLEFDYILANSIGTDPTPATVTFAFGERPVCTPDGPYPVTGNIPIDTTIDDTGANAYLGVLNNDTGDFITVTTIVGSGDTTPPYIGTTTNGGSVSMQDNGEFTYTPPTGVTGINDTFSYQITNGFGSVTTNCDVTLQISDMIYFMDDTASPGGDGSLSNPFQTIAEHNSGSVINNSVLFIADNGLVYTGNLQLVQGQRVIGQGATGALFGGGSLSGITLSPISVPVSYNTTGNANDWAQITNPAGNGITLNTNNTLLGIEVGNTAGYGMINTGTSSVGNLTISESRIIGTGDVLRIANGGTLNATFTSLSTTSAPSVGILLGNVNGSLSATLTEIASVNDAINVSGGAVNLGLNLTGLGLSTTNGDALQVNGHTGQINITHVAAGLSATNGACVDIVGASVINIDVATCSAVNAPSFGIRLQNTAGSLFRVQDATSVNMLGGSTNGILLDSVSTTNIDISDGSTLTVSNRSDTGIRLNNVTSTSVNFGNTTVNNPNGVNPPAVALLTVTPLVDFDMLNIDQGSAGSGETFVTVGNGSFPNDNSGNGDAVYASNASGGLTINGGTISNIADDGFDWRNSGVLTLNNVLINKGVGTTGTAGIQSYNSTGIDMNGGSITNFGSGTVPGQRPLAVNILHDGVFTTPIAIFSFDSVDFDGGAGRVLGGGIAQYTVDNSNITVEVINGSTFTNVFGKAIITQNSSTTNGTVTTTITGNTFNTPLTAGQSSVEVASGGVGMTGNVAFNINNNVFNNFGDGQGTAILINLNQNTNARTQTNTIHNNTISDNDAPGGIGIIIDETSGLRLQANNNSVSGVTATAFSVQGLNSWSSGDVDIAMTNSTYANTGTSSAVIVTHDGTTAATNIRILWDNVDVNAPNSSLDAVEMYSRGQGRVDWVTTNGDFSNGAGGFETIYVQAGSGGNPATFCVDFNDDGGGPNTTNNGFFLNEPAGGNLLVENGTTVAAVLADNPGMSGASTISAGAAVGTCNDATP